MDARVPLALSFALLAPTADALGVDVDLALPVGGDVSVAVDAPLVDEALEAASTVVRQAVPLAPAPAEAPVLAPAVATVGLLALLQSMGALRLAWGAALALYFRVRPSELLGNEHREQVLALVRARPGIGPSDIARTLLMGWGTVSYHLDRLERGGLLVSERTGHHRCYFTPGAVPREARHHVGLMRGESARLVASFVLARPGATQSEMCSQLGLSASAASKHVSRLEDARLVRREGGDGRVTHVFPEPALAAALGT